MQAHEIIVSKTTGEAKMTGVSFAGKMTLAAENKHTKLIAVSQTGGDYWSGNFQPRAYEPATWRVWHYTKRQDEGAVVIYTVNEISGDIQWKKKGPWELNL